MDTLGRTRKPVFDGALKAAVVPAAAAARAFSFSFLALSLSSKLVARWKLSGYLKLK